MPNAFYFSARIEMQPLCQSVSYFSLLHCSSILEKRRAKRWPMVLRMSSFSSIFLFTALGGIAILKHSICETRLATTDPWRWLRNQAFARKDTYSANDSLDGLIFDFSGLSVYSGSLRQVITGMSCICRYPYVCTFRQKRFWPWFWTTIPAGRLPVPVGTVPYRR